jgi:1-acyl-sn-glycerol-3-phosphate acyltransferase
MVRIRRRAALVRTLTGLVLDVRPAPDLAARVLAALDVTVQVRGGLLAEPAPGPGTLIVANHVSWLDDVALMAALPGVRPVAKAEIGDWPLIGAQARRSGTVFLDRSRLRRLPHTVSEVAGILRGGQDVFLHPEGTTGCGVQLGRFRPAFFQAALEAGAEVRPVALRYRLRDRLATSVAGYVGEVSLRASLRRVVATSALVVELDVLPALRPGGDRRQMAAAAERAVAAVLGDHLRRARSAHAPELVAVGLPARRRREVSRREVTGAAA